MPYGTEKLDPNLRSVFEMKGIFEFWGLYWTDWPEPYQMFTPLFFGRLQVFPYDLIRVEKMHVENKC